MVPLIGYVMLTRNGNMPQLWCDFLFSVHLLC